MLFSYVICPATEIDILIGLKYAGYHPVRQRYLNISLFLEINLVAALVVVSHCYKRIK